MALPTKNRLRGKKDFDLVFKNGRTVKGRFLLVKYIRSLTKNSRISFIVPSKIAKKAVDRNKIKRILAGKVQKNMNKFNKDAAVLVLKLPDKKSWPSELTKDIENIMPNFYE